MCETNFNRITFSPVLYFSSIALNLAEFLAGRVPHIMLAKYPF